MCSTALADNLVAFDGRPESVHLARDHVIARLGPNHGAREVTQLLVSELATNAVVHTFSNGGTFWLLVEQQADCVRIDVMDEGSTSHPHMCVGSLDESGRGLCLVDTLASDWGVYETDFGRAVYCIIPNDADHRDM